MRISWVETFAQASSSDADLIVFPEYARASEVRETAATLPDALVVAALQRDRRSYGLALHERKNRIRYTKIESDGFTDGTYVECEPAVYVANDIVVGVIICRDI